jgi:hypothetical protein
MNRSSMYIMFSAILCIIVCAGEFVALFIFGSFYPGYNHLRDTMSLLGTSGSPVSAAISAWWIVMGMMMIFFGTGVKMAFKAKGRVAGYAALSIILYGMGEGIGSGVFKADRLVQGFPVSALIHDILGGAGTLAILMLPLIMQKIITKHELPAFYRFSRIIFITGIAFIVLFMFRYTHSETNLLAVYKGLWQRLFLLNTYIYMVTIAVLIIKKPEYHGGA